MDVWGKGYFFFIITIVISLLALPVAALVPVWDTTLPVPISDIAISDDGSRVIAGTTDGNARVYDQDGALLWETKVPGSLLVACQGNGNAYLVASQEDAYSNKGSARLYDSNGNQLYLYHTGWPKAIAVSNKTDQSVIANLKGDIVVLNRTGAEVAAFNDFPKDYPVLSLSLSGDGKVFAYVLKDRYPQVQYVTIQSKSKRSFSRYSKNDKAWTGEDEPIGQVLVSDDGAYVATSGGEGNHGLLCLYSKSGTRLWSRDILSIAGLEITGNGSAVYTVTSEGNVTSYNRNGNITWVYTLGCEGRDTSLSVDTGILAVGTGKGDIYVFDATGMPLAASGIDGFPYGEIGEVAISRAGNALVASANGKEIHYYVVEAEPASPPSVTTPAVTASATTSSAGRTGLNQTEVKGAEPIVPGTSLVTNGTGEDHAEEFPKTELNTTTTPQSAGMFSWVGKIMEMFQNLF